MKRRKDGKGIEKNGKGIKRTRLKNKQNKKGKEEMAMGNARKVADKNEGGKKHK